MPTHEPRTEPRRERPTLRGSGGPIPRRRPAPTEAAGAPRSWRSQVMVLSGLNVLAGIWLIIAPWVLGYSTSDPRWNDVVFGIVIGVLALIRATGGVREDWVSAVNALIGIWLIVAAFTIDQTATATWNDIILGIIVFVLAVASLEAGAPRFAGRRGASTSTL